ncbi:TetR/AcrR family transcriptional regulator [Rhodococcus opacus]|uniref:TetR/AcrR family transcriptional regulator n=1 Tax=Rhodococcus opacus TaxID=37919 RepID=UPI002235F57A|nr:TetR/AcrR family transcriptional regulator [Rhodococcus opacus]UZG55107.1 TetR family transcriptional regulator [Rhodococcus opacus]
MSTDVSGRVKRESRDEVRQLLLGAAIRAVARDGMRTLTTKAVAAEAGVTHRLLLLHFPSQDDLLVAALQHALDRSIGVLARLTDTDALEDLLDGLTRQIDHDPDLQTFQYELILESRRRPELGAAVRLLYATLLDSTRAALERVGVTPDDDLTLLVYAAVDGLALQHLVRGDASATNASLVRLRAMLSKER